MVLGRLTTGYIQQLPIVIFYYQHVVVVSLIWQCYKFILYPLSTFSINMTTSVSRRSNMLSIAYKIITFLVVTVFAW
jgi:hypothetical protein